MEIHTSTYVILNFLGATFSKIKGTRVLSFNNIFEPDGSKISFKHEIIIRIY